MTAPDGDRDQYRIEGDGGCTSVTVPLIHHVGTMPYYASHQQWAHHRDGCRQCSTPGWFARPCLEGAVLQGRLGEQLQRQHAASHQN